MIDAGTGLSALELEARTWDDELSDAQASPELLRGDLAAAVESVPSDPLGLMRRDGDAARGGEFGGWLSRTRDRDFDPRTGELVGQLAYVPRSTYHCLAGTLWMALQRESSEELEPIRMDCGSWRCPKCAPRVNRRDFFRIKKALEPIDADGAVFITLTFSRKEWGDAYAASRAAGACAQKFRRNLQYQLAKRGGWKPNMGWPLPKLPYLAVWEQHLRPDEKGQWLHAHILIQSRELHRWLRDTGYWEVANNFKTDENGKPRLERRYKLAAFNAETKEFGALAELARRAGFGRIDALPLDGTDGLDAYMSKLSFLAAEFSGSLGKSESSSSPLSSSPRRKRTQYPTHAPRHFRRIQASRGFLEPTKRKLGEVALNLAEVFVAPAEVVNWAKKVGGGRLLKSATAFANVVKETLADPAGTAAQLAREFAEGVPDPPRVWNKPKIALPDGLSGVSDCPF